MGWGGVDSKYRRAWSSSRVVVVDELKRMKDLPALLDFYTSLSAHRLETVCSDELFAIQNDI